MNALKQFLAPFVPDCQRAARLQSELLDRELSFTKRFGLKLHLLICRWCRRYGRQIRFLHHAAHSHTDEHLGDAFPALSADARARIKQKLRADA